MGNAAAKEASAPPPPAPLKANEEPEQKLPSFRVLSADQRAITFDERVHLRAGAEARADRVTLGLGAMSDFRPLQRAATYDPRLRSQKQLLTASDVIHRRFFNAQERRVSADRNLFRIAEGERERQEAVVVVDPYSTGMTLAEKVMERGYPCICVYSDTLEVTQERISHVPKELATKFLAIIYNDGEVERKDETQALKDTAAALRRVTNVDIVGIFAGAETGVLLADKLSEHFNLTTNGTSGSAARRNKYLMGEKVRAAGIRAVAQVQATKWSQVENFVKKDLVPMLKGGDFKVIVKPVESAGSDDVMLCHSMEEVRTAFGNIQGKINGLGLENQATLVQEYLDGTEYVVDTVSRNGVTKVVAVWEYDKRAVNDAPFVYYGVLLRAAPDGSVLAKVADYVLKVVKALEIVHGPGHAEVKVVRGEPCLVEIGARCHGGSGSYLPIVTPCLGYNHVDAALDSYLDAEAFERLPDRPKELKSHGCEAMLVSYETGKLAGYPGQEELENLPSTVSTMWFTHAGEELKTTVDMFTTPGSVIMVHEEEEQLNRDYARIRELEHSGLYALEPEEEIEAKTESRGTVVIVDPFSTGAVLAHELMARGYDCICVYSDRLENIESVASLVPEGLTLEFAATVAFEGNLNQTVSAIRKAAKQVADKQNKKKKSAKVTTGVRAVFAGAELGVKLADALTDAFGLDGNVMEHSNARRDKYLMGETLRSAGVRAVKQVKAKTWAEAEAFITHDLKPEPFEVVLKPLESAGTEDVVLCLSLEEAKRTFEGILGKINGLGLKNDAVLLQEYLEGDEYVVDTVSRNGEHKVTAIWKYDKRRVNDAAFVYFGLSLVPAEGIVNDMIDYQFQVLDALGIRQGPAHGEVKFCHGSPVLIEVGSRCHGGEGAWVPIANICVGYNQVTASVESILDSEAFAKLTDRPRKLLAYGCEAMLVSYKNGVLKSTPGIAEIEKMPAFLKKEIFVGPGDNVRQTVDMFTTPGSIMLTHKDRKVLEGNLARIRELEVEGLFELQ
ncbi:Dapdiamide A synthase [Phytophthora citrophthora]|uniref:Dapdiamide A synthase n=1 Tax=Phytophthora citrophthora TaxID=4793 RepID=A0AAD9G1T2_9STRA|nr:Dapdiamide A synthase [Phytophthora citrophthora]